MKKIILTLCLFGLTSIVYAQRDEFPEFQKAKEVDSEINIKWAEQSGLRTLHYVRWTNLTESVLNYLNIVNKGVNI